MRGPGAIGAAAGAAAALALIVTLSASGPPPAPQARPTSSVEVVTATARSGGSSPLALLARAASACRTTSYSGVQLVTMASPAGVTSALVDVTAVPGRGVRQRARPTGGDPDETRVTLPTADPASVTEALHLLANRYVLRAGGPARLLDRRADLVIVQHRDGSVAARLWLDRQTGLLLRREHYDGAGRLVRASAFVEFAPRPPQLLGGAPAPPGPWARAAPARLRAEGWPVPDVLPHGLALVAAREAVLSGRPVVHLHYSDGLAAVSVFVERGRLAPQGPPGWRSLVLAGRQAWSDGGLPPRVITPGPGLVYTVLADASVQTVTAAVASLPAPSSTSSFARLRRGLARAGSWLNPFA